MIFVKSDSHVRINDHRVFLIRTCRVRKCTAIDSVCVLKTNDYSHRSTGLWAEVWVWYETHLGKLADSDFVRCADTTLAHMSFWCVFYVSTEFSTIHKATKMCFYFISLLFYRNSLSLFFHLSMVWLDVRPPQWSWLSVHGVWWRDCGRRKHDGKLTSHVWLLFCNKRLQWN